MKNSFTLNDLIQFAFKGAKQTEKNDEGKMETDEEIHDYQSMIGMNLWSDSSFPAPDKRIVNNILNYSKSLSVYKLKSIGVMNVMMN
jgi:hypothetical protein